MKRLPALITTLVVALAVPASPAGAADGTAAGPRLSTSGAISDAVVIAPGESDGLGRVPRRLEPTTTGRLGRSVQGAQTGPVSVLVLRVEFTGTSPQPFVEPFTKAQVRARLMTDPQSAANIYKEQSGGLTTLKGLVNQTQGDVSDWVAVPGAVPTGSFGCDPDAIRTKVLTQLALTPAKVDGTTVLPNQYQHVMLLFPETSACSWAGLGELPGSVTWINGLYIEPYPPSSGVPAGPLEWDASLFAHELGHNFGAAHAASLACYSPGTATPVALSDDCDPLEEYGDPFDLMGGGPANPPVAFYGTQLMSSLHRYQLRQAPGAEPAVITAPGTYALFDANAPAGAPGTRLLRISRGTADPSIGSENRELSLELRTTTGPFDAWAEEPGFFTGASSGVIARVGPSTSLTQRSQLIDTEPLTPTLLDAPMGAGESFVDGATGMTVSVISIALDGSSAEIAVGPVLPPATPTTPTATITVTPQASTTGPAAPLSTATPAAAPASVATDPTLVFVPVMLKPAPKGGRGKLPKSRRVTLSFPGSGVVEAKVGQRRIATKTGPRVTFKLPASVRRNGTVKLVASGGTLPSPIRAQLRIKAGVVRLVITG